MSEATLDPASSRYQEVAGAVDVALADWIRRVAETAGFDKRDAPAVVSGMIMAVVRFDLDNRTPRFTNEVTTVRDVNADLFPAVNAAATKLLTPKG